MNKIIIVTGQYGCGKTEFSLNLGIKLKSENINVAIADYDVINPYFRTREKAEYLNKMGIRVLGNTTDNTTGQDLPALSGNIFNLEDTTTIIDLAGSENGINPLSLIKDSIKNYEMLYIVNVFRPETMSLEENLKIISSLENKSGFKVTGIVNNSHLISETIEDHILEGNKVAEEISKSLSIPIKYTLIDEKFLNSPLLKCINSEFLSFDSLKMRQQWQM